MSLWLARNRHDLLCLKMLQTQTYRAKMKSGLLVNPDIETVPCTMTALLRAYPTHSCLGSTGKHRLVSVMINTTPFYATHQCLWSLFWLVYLVYNVCIQTLLFVAWTLLIWTWMSDVSLLIFQDEVSGWKCDQWLLHVSLGPVVKLGLHRAWEVTQYSHRSAALVGQSWCTLLTAGCSQMVLLNLEHGDTNLHQTCPVDVCVIAPSVSEQRLPVLYN